MLIKGVGDEVDSSGVVGDVPTEYSAANELFEIMARNHHLDDIGNNLSESELVLLYKNVDVGTEMMNTANSVPFVRPPNQRVETIVYEADSDSDVSQHPSWEDIHTCQKELHNINKSLSYDQTLCHKNGGLQIPFSHHSIQYEKFFCLQDQTMKGLRKRSKFNSSSPPTLLDYVCGSSAETDAYMESMIRHFQHTIDQLRRICNGDYLTDKAKQKWKDSGFIADYNNTKLLAACSSQPLDATPDWQQISAWDDIMHSEVDMRTLTKLLDKKIVIKVPREICGTYKLFTKRCEDNALMRLTKEGYDKQKENTMLNVALKVDRLETGEIISEIASITLLKTTEIQEMDIISPPALPAPEDDIISIFDSEKSIKQLNCESINTVINEEPERDCNSVTQPTENTLPSINEIEPIAEKSEEESCVSIGDISNDQSEIIHDYNVEINTHTTELIVYNHESSVTTEHCDAPITVAKTKEGPKKIRIKSPYENKLFKSEEKRRRKLIEIREKRARKSMNCDIMQLRKAQARGSRVCLPKSSNSVTKLSITNKAFYNSIFGGKLKDHKRANQRKETDIAIPENLEDDILSKNSLPFTPEPNIKYVDRSYYLDDMVTGVEMIPSSEDIHEIDLMKPQVEYFNDPPSQIVIPKEVPREISAPRKTVRIIAPVTSPSTKNPDKFRAKVNSLRRNNEAEPNEKAISRITALECRKRIDKIYTLMKKISDPDTKTLNETRERTGQHCFTDGACETDSGTSVKQNVESAYPNNFLRKNIASSTLRTSVPKVVIRSKTDDKSKAQKIKKETRASGPLPSTVKPTLDKPLQTISKLLQEYNQTQRIRNRVPPRNDPKNRPYRAESPRRAPLAGTRESPRLTNTHYRDRRYPSPKKPMKIDIKPPARLEAKPPVRLETKPPVRLEMKPPVRLEIKQPTRLEIKPPVKFETKTPMKVETKPSVPQRMEVNPHLSRLESLAQPRWAASRPERMRRHDNVGGEAASPKRNSPEPTIHRRPPAAAAGSKPPSTRRNSPPRTRVQSPRNSLLVARLSNHSMVPLSRTSGVGSRGSPVSKPAERARAAVSAGTERHPSRLSRAPLVPLDTLSDTNTHINLSSGSHVDSSIIGCKLHEFISALSIANGSSLRHPSHHSPHSPHNPRKPDAAVAPATLKDADVPNVMRDEPKSPTTKSLDTTIEDNAEDENKCIKRTPSDCTQFIVDVYGDKSVLTAVEAISEDSGSGVTELKEGESRGEMEQLQHALYSQLVWGPGGRRRRRRPLASRHSLQHLVLSAAGSLASPVASSKSDTVAKLSFVSRHQLGADVGFPVQVATVGFAFPHYKETDFIDNLMKHGDNNPQVNKKLVSENTKSVSLSKLSVSLINPQKSVSEILPREKSASRSRVSVVELKEQFEKKIRSADEKTVDSKTSNALRTLDTTAVENVKRDTVDESDKKMTSSLDLLVSLLGEIQKITATQLETDLVPKLNAGPFEDKLIRNLDYSNSEIVSVASFYSMRPINARPSAYSFLSEISIIFPICEHKEVSVNFPPRELVSRVTGVQSRFAVSQATCATAVTSSLVHLADHSLHFTDSEQIISNTVFSADSFQKITEIPTDESQNLNNFEATVNSEQPPHDDALDNLEDEKVIINLEVECRAGRDDREKMEAESKVTNTKCCTAVFDSSTKMKRDILVTVYSILVFTVFAALTVPEFMYRAL